MKTLAHFEKLKDFWFLLIVSFIFFILRLPSLFEPYWYGDEGIYQVIGLALRNGRFLYRDIWDNKPPLLYLLYALFNSDQFTVRLISIIFGLLTVIAFFFLAKKLFNQKMTYLTTAFFALMFALPLIEGNIANAENFMLLPIILAALLIFKTVQKMPACQRFAAGNAGRENLFLAGFLLGLAFLIKIVAIFDFIAFLVFLFILITPFKQIKPIEVLTAFIGKVYPLVAGFFIPFLITMLFFLLNNTLIDFLNATFFQMFGYVGYGNKFFIPQGFLLLKLILLCAFLLSLFLKRNKIELTVLFTLIWLGFSFFNALLAQRPYTHYLLVLLPSFSLLVGLIFWQERYQKIIFAILLVLVFFLSKNFIFYEKTVGYYQNFIEFIANKKQLSTYRSFFDKKTPIDYELASFIKTHTNKMDRIFIWGNNAQVYKLTNKLPSGRYTVAYHMTSDNNSLRETSLALDQTLPKLIIIMADQKNFPYQLTGYSLRFVIGNALIYERTI